MAGGNYFTDSDCFPYCRTTATAERPTLLFVAAYSGCRHLSRTTTTLVGGLTCLAAGTSRGPFGLGAASGRGQAATAGLGLRNAGGSEKGLTAVGPKSDS